MLKYGVFRGQDWHPVPLKNGVSVGQYTGLVGVGVEPIVLGIPVGLVAFGFVALVVVFVGVVTLVTGTQLC